MSNIQIEKTVLDKSADTLLEKAAECFDLAKGQQNLADKQHEIATTQHENADQQKALSVKEDSKKTATTQRENADQQHALAAKQDSNADRLDASAEKLNTMGHALEASAVGIKGETLVVQRGQK